MTYREKLLDPLWIDKRHWVIRLDNYHCRKCSKTPVYSSLKVNFIIRGEQTIKVPENTYLILEEKLNLNVHHKYYKQGYEPWEYDDEALITLCPDCHKKEHENNSIPVLLASDEIKYANICDRCGGSGYLPQFDYYLDGICFKCWGEGIDIDDLE
jgi:hypothetical protein